MAGEKKTYSEILKLLEGIRDSEKAAPMENKILGHLPETSKPLVNTGSLKPGELASEAGLADQQEIIQKPISGSEYIDKLKRLGLMGAGGAAVGASTLGGNNNASASEMPSVPMHGELGATPIQDTTPEQPGRLQQLQNYLKNTASGGAEMLSVPSAALRNAAYAAQTNKPIGEAIYQGAVNPDQAKTGEDIAQATGISDEHPYVKAALATAADLADPTDLATMGEGKFSKLAGMMKGR
jgi:hypothetical protein